MHLARLHPWPKTIAAALALQRELAPRINRRPGLRRWSLVAGTDVAFGRHSPEAIGGVVIWSANGDIVERAVARQQVQFPYVPGLLSFRELPVLLAAFQQIREVPDVVLADGHGYAHPRRFGLACHLGLWLDIPTIGCAKSILVGRHGELGPAAGCTAPLVEGRDIVGMALRTRHGVRPVYVSVGHRINLAAAVRVVLACCRGRRLPEPLRLAHHLVTQARASIPRS
ncbi:MAG: endonuclease V [Gemmataceae bacterium]